MECRVTLWQLAIQHLIHAQKINHVLNIKLLNKYILYKP